MTEREHEYKAYDELVAKLQQGNPEAIYRAMLGYDEAIRETKTETPHSINYIGESYWEQHKRIRRGAKHESEAT